MPKLGEYLDELAQAGFDRVIGTSGTILSLGGLATGRCRAARPAPRCATGGSPAKQLRRVRKQLVELSLDKRLRVPGLDPRRADLRSPAPILLDTIVRRLGRREHHALRSCRCARAWCSTTSRATARRSRRPIAIPTSAAAASSSWPSAATTGRSTPQQVARLALALFEQTRGVHALTDREREWLEYAALLHDIGVHISYESHHKHSYYLIKNGDLRGFEPDEVEIIALVARYHRRAHAEATPRGLRRVSPRKRRRVVRTLSAHAAAGRKPRSQPRAEPSPASSCTIAARTRCCRCGRPATPSWSCGRPQRHAAPVRAAARQAAAGRSQQDTPYAEQPDEAPRVPGKAVRRRRHRRLGKDDAARAAGEVAERRGAPGVRHRMELVRPGQGGDQDGQEEERADADDVQPAARHRLR